MKPQTLFSLALLSLPLAVSAQIPGTQNPPRIDDQFHRQLIVSRVDMNEKANQSLVLGRDASLYDQNGPQYTQGLIASLVKGYREGKYIAYNPENVSQAVTYDEAVKTANKYTGSNEPDPVIDPECADCEDPFFIEPAEPGDPEGDVDPTPGVPNDFSLAPLENVFEIIENRIIDKNRSDVIHDVQYIRLVWVDPTGAIPDRNFLCFKYSDVIQQLESTPCVNKFNDAEARNMREMFENRAMTSFVTNISGMGVRTLAEAQMRRDQLTAYEHQLWSY